MGVQSIGERSGVHPSGLGWPDIIIGAREIGLYMRISEKAAQKWCHEGRLPAQKDGKGRWFVNKWLIVEWCRAGVKLHREKQKLSKSATPRAGQSFDGWSEEYKCGCTSDVVSAKRKLLGYCPIHGEDRIAIYTGEKP